MSVTFAFDVYGTLINPLAMSDPLRKVASEKADEVAKLWRETQLAYSFRRATMAAYVPFSQVTAEALDFAFAACGIEAQGEEKAALLAQYTRLPAFEEVPVALKYLSELGHRMHAFSNGTFEDIRTLTESAGLAQSLGAPVSVEDVQTFKPDPRVYALFEQKTGSVSARTWLVSSNPFDIIGAGEAGWNTVWVRRNPGQPFDTWGRRPTHVVSNLGEIPHLIA